MYKKLIFYINMNYQIFHINLLNIESKYCFILNIITNYI